MELRNLDAENFAALETLRRQYEDELQQILTDGCAQGAFVVADSRIATMGIIAMLTGVSTWFRDSGRLSRRDVEEIYWDMTRRAVACSDA